MKPSAKFSTPANSLVSVRVSSTAAVKTVEATTDLESVTEQLIDYKDYAPCSSQGVSKPLVGSVAESSPEVADVLKPNKTNAKKRSEKKSSANLQLSWLKEQKPSSGTIPENSSTTCIQPVQRNSK